MTHLRLSRSTIQWTIPTAKVVKLSSSTSVLLQTLMEWLVPHQVTRSVCLLAIHMQLELHQHPPIRSSGSTQLVLRLRLQFFELGPITMKNHYSTMNTNSQLQTSESGTLPSQKLLVGVTNQTLISCRSGWIKLTVTAMMSREYQFLHDGTFNSNSGTWLLDSNGEL